MTDDQSTEAEEAERKFWTERAMQHARTERAEDIKAQLSRYSLADGFKVWAGIFGVIILALMFASYLQNQPL